MWALSVYMIIDKLKFESRSRKGCSNSHYIFMRTVCCGRIGIEDLELSEFYFDSGDPTISLNLFEELICPFCDSGSWDLVEIEPLKVSLKEWSWVIQ